MADSAAYTENKDPSFGLAPPVSPQWPARETPVPNQEVRFAVVLYGGVSPAIEYAGVSRRLNNWKQSGLQGIQRILSNGGVRRREENENVVP
jgi:hypothetical protein